VDDFGADDSRIEESVAEELGLDVVAAEPPKVVTRIFSRIPVVE
jgi:hypothetical protein